MSTKQSLPLLSLIAVLLLVVSACDFGGAPTAGTSSSGAGAGAGAGGATPTTVAAAPPTSLPSPAQTALASIPTIAAAGETRAVKKLSSGLEKLKSYRAQFAIAFDGADKNNTPQKGTLNFLRENNNENKDQHIKLASAGDLSGAFGNSTGGTNTNDTFEIYHVTNNSFLVPNGKCQFLGSGDSSISNTPLFSPDDFLGSLDKAVLVNRGENVNGVQADHYQVTNNVLTGSGMEGMKIAQGDIWISRDDYVVKATGTAAGTTKSGSKGTVTLDYNIDQINSLPVIKLPADCVAPTQASDVPVPPNATDTKLVNVSGATLTTFKTTDDSKAVADFYRQKLPPLGWKLDADQNNAAGASMQFSKDSGKRLLNIAIFALGGSITVTLTDKAAAK